jgi:hypothetical protein
MSVWLDNEKGSELKKFHCPVCGKVVFEYYNDVKILMPGELGDVKKSPIVVQCHGKTPMKTADGMEIFVRCKARYFIA